ncbi:hypothetical protein B9G55_15210 [Saccharibacillus sp. O16]|nr:hypothetical protein B9G55_15210 [Saccharibacillus sp. O16]
MLLEKLVRADGFSAAEKEIARCILERREEVLGMTIRQLAEAAYSSNPTIVRLCRKLGVGGYREFKIMMASELERAADSGAINANVPFDRQESPGAIARKIADLTRSTVREAELLLDSRALDAAASLLDRCQQVYLFAVGDSMIRAMSFQGKLLKINRQVQISHLMQEQGYYAYQASAQDCAMFITYHGRQPGYLEYAETMRANGTSLIAVTADGTGELAKRCDLVLQLPVDEDPLEKIATFSSQIAIDYVLNVLYSCIFNLRYEQNFARKQAGQAYVQRIERE